MTLRLLPTLRRWLGLPAQDRPACGGTGGRPGECLLPVVFLLLSLCTFSPAQTVIEAPPDKFQIILLGEKDEPTDTRAGPLKIIGLEDNPALRKGVEDAVWEARRRLRNSTRVDWEGTAFVVWAENDDDYRAWTGKMPEFTAAAASAARRTVWINGPVWRRSPPREQLAVLTHELAHLLVGNLPGGRRVPLWFEEGLVMHLAGEWTLERSLAVSRAHAFGQLPELAELESAFPADPEMQTLAYAVGFLAAQEIARSYGDEADAPQRLMRRLADEDAGPRLAGNLWDPAIRDGWNARVLEHLGGRVTHLVILLTSGTAVWFLAMALVFWAWWKKRKRRLEAARAELAAEPWLESLTEDDRRAAWGLREDEIAPREPEDEYPWEKWERLKEKDES